MGRGDDDRHRLALQQRLPFESAIVLDQVGELEEEISPEVRVGELPATELTGHLDPVAGLQELDGTPNLRVEIAGTDLWLDPEMDKIDRLKPLLCPYPAREMKAFPVSMRVNSPTRDNPGCIEPCGVTGLPL